MKRKFSLFLAALLVALFLSAGCGGAATQTETKGFEPQMTAEERAEAILSHMTLSEKIGQMLMIGVHGTELDADSRFMLSEYDVGGVILFDRNLETAENVRRITKELQEARHGEPPLLIAI
ncbi:MAG: glycoside hydrolase family 3 protein, partial [Schwartzia sp.]|nr:glycoside hydrolase family 3 protein [Schwartzia sp. (in: firmicutes)]